MKYQLLKDGVYQTIVSTRTDVPVIKQVDVKTALSRMSIDYSMGIGGVELSLTIPPLGNYDALRSARSAVMAVAESYRVLSQQRTIKMAEGLERFYPIAVMELKDMTHQGDVFIGKADDTNPIGAHVIEDGVAIYLTPESFDEPGQMARDLFMVTYQAKMLMA